MGNEENPKSEFLDVDMDLTMVIWKDFSQSQDERLVWKKIRKSEDEFMFEETKSGKYLTTKTVGETPITVIVGMINKTPLIMPN